MGWLNINGNWIGRHSGKSVSSYWTTLISATVENAAPTNVVLTFPTAKPALGATDFTIAGFTISSASWTGAVLTLVLSTPVLWGDSLTVTFVVTGGTTSVTNNVAMVAEYLAVYNSLTTKPSDAIAKGQNKMVYRLVDSGIFAKRDIFYLFAQTTNDASEALVNWKNPGTFNATLVGTPAFVANEGFTGSTNNAIRTNYNPTTAGGNFTLTSHSVAIGIGTDVTEDAQDFGYWVTSQTNGIRLNSGIAGVNALFNDYYGSSGSYARAGGATKAAWYINRNGDDIEVYRNSIKKVTTAAPVSFYSGEIYILTSLRVGVGLWTTSTKQVRWFAAGALLTMQEVQLETSIVEEFLYSIGANLYPYAPDNDLLLTTNGETVVTFRMSGHAGAAPVVIDWGDGTNTGLTLGLDIPDAATAFTHTYASAIPYTITISHANSIKELRFGYTTVSNLEQDISVFNNCGALEYLGFHSFENDWTGSINGLPKTIKSFYYTKENTGITGDITLFEKLVTFYCATPIGGTMNVTNHPDLTVFNISGGCTVDLDLTGMTKLTHLDSYAGSSFCHGDVTLCVALVQMCIGTPNEFYGSIEGCANFAYLDNHGDSHMEGDISALTAIYRFRSYNCSNAFTGNITNLVLLQELLISNDNSNIDRPATIDNKPSINQLECDTWSFTEAEVNQILADKWADRNASYGAGTTRKLDLSTGTSAAPTGQGIIDRDALRLYRSPTPPGTAALWTVLTK